MKVLIIRFSSIGDIVLTTPVIRCIKQQVKNVELHYLTKKQFAGMIESNPHIDKTFAIEKNTSEIIPALKMEKYDAVIDLHRNIRSKQVKSALKAKAFSFDKLNFKKWLLVNFKVNKMPAVHIVERYLYAAKELGVVNDSEGLEYFIPEKNKVSLSSLPSNFQNEYYALVLGGTYFTKQIPPNKLDEICKLSKKNLVLLGGKAEQVQGDELERKFPGKVFNACGKFSLDQSASLIQQSQRVITSDTGLMHIAAAFKKDIISVWGNTVPEFGMYPYLPGEKSKMLEVKNLSCRPCSKLGYKKCPRGHFKCMNDQVIEL